MKTRAKKPNRERSLLGWHFIRTSGYAPVLNHGDGRPVLPGKTLSVSGGTSLCSKGLHASRLVHQAYGYCDGQVLCRVKVWGDIRKSYDKFCGSHRKVIWMVRLTARQQEYVAKLRDRKLPEFRGLNRFPSPAVRAVWRMAITRRLEAKLASELRKQAQRQRKRFATRPPGA
jgi:hypothetical protein